MAHLATSEATSRARTWRRVPMLLPAGLALVLGVDGGLELIGLPAVPVSRRLPDVHGFLLVLGVPYLHKNRLFAFALLAAPREGEETAADPAAGTPERRLSPGASPAPARLPVGSHP